MKLEEEDRAAFSVAGDRAVPTSICRNCSPWLAISKSIRERETSWKSLPGLNGK